jgi:hypothetical protein
MAQTEAVVEIKSLVSALMIWIGDNSGYDTSKLPPPEIIELTPEQLTAEAYLDYPKLLPADGVDERVIALYAFDDGLNGTIYVLAPHWAQDADNGKTHVRTRSTRNGSCTSWFITCSACQGRTQHSRAETTEKGKLTCWAANS